MTVTANPIITITTERFFWRIVSLLMLGDLLIGLIFIFGSPALSPAFTATNSLMAPEAWGIFAIAANSVFVFGLWRHDRRLMLAGLSMGGFYTTLFGITFMFAAIGGFHQGLTGIVWWLVIGAMHTIAAITLPSTAKIKRLQYDDSADHIS